MHLLNTDLIERAVQEIERREPQYLMRIPVSFPVPYVRTDRYAGHPGLKDHEKRRSRKQ
jgi:hypothetical protein